MVLRVPGLRINRILIVRRFSLGGCFSSLLPFLTFILEADRKQLLAANDDLSFITVKVVDAAGNLVPDADAEIGFSILGNGYVAGVDNGLPTSMESFKASKRKAWKGKCLVIVGEKDKKGKLIVQANSPGLRGAVLVLDVQ